MNVSIRKTIALVVALAKLHNFFIDSDNHRSDCYTLSDQWQHEVNGAAPLIPIRTDDSHLNDNNAGGVAEQSMNGGNHNNNIGGRQGQYNRQRHYDNNSSFTGRELLREHLHLQIATMALT
jgi:hypothetical protein